SDPVLEPGASFTVAPLSALGWDRVSVFLRLPKGGATLELQQGLRGGPLATTNAIRMRGAGAVAAEYPRGGEVIGIVFKNGAAAHDRDSRAREPFRARTRRCRNKRRGGITMTTGQNPPCKGAPPVHPVRTPAGKAKMQRPEDYVCDERKGEWVERRTGEGGKR